MPQCSIVIPVHGRSSLTRQCLDTLLGTSTGVATEIIVVDDASRDLTPRLLAGYGARIRVVTRATNGGFAVACNDGARTASGKYLVLLNNDTIPQPGWLGALVRAAEADGQTAVVGSKLVYPNDTIQHAGVVICQDRYPRHVYRGFPADHPAVNRSRRFRIVTGAAMLVRREAFDEVGGFDETFVNAYEDHDLCLRLGERGHHVRYCHESVLVHLEGATRARRTNEQDRAARLFRMRWGSRLEPDDLAYYIEDGLLRIGYWESYPLRLAISPLLATLDEEVRGREAERLLATRSRQVYDLLRRHSERGAQAPAGTDGGAATAAGADSSDPLVPPAELACWVGPDDFGRSGEEYLQYFVALGGLKPSDHVLDVGCGVGRMALPLTRYLTAGGSYEGFDVMAGSIDWCREHITPRFPSFRFQHADLRNGFYNREGGGAAAEYRFPYEDDSFDFVLLTSVFTHILLAERDRYLAEVARVVRPGGTCFATFFLLNEESLALLWAGLSPGLPFRHRLEGCRIHDSTFPEAAVAYDEVGVRAAYAARGLSLTEPIRYGGWCGRLDGLGYQDIVIATKS